MNYSYNKDDRPVNPTQHTIPTDAHLRGDFSDLLAIDPVRYQIYDPLTVKPDPQRPGFFIRDPFPGNIIPQSRIINPMYQHYVDLPSEAEQQSGRSSSGADEQLSGAHLHGSDPEPDLRRAPRLQPFEYAPVLRPLERKLLHRRSRRLDLSKRGDPLRRHEADDECRNRQLDVGEELDDRHRRAVEREHVPRRWRTQDARRDASSDVGLPAYLDEKCAASDAARTGSSRGSSCALPSDVGIGRNYQQFGKNAAEGYDTTNCRSPRT